MNVSAANFNHTLDEVSQSSGGMSHSAVTGTVAAGNYAEAAYLASQMTTSNNALYEEAMWQVVGYALVFSGYNTTAVNTLISNTTGSAGLTSFDANDLADWGVISGGTAVQEFIYECRNSNGAATACNPSGNTQSVTPEPATMSLMAMGLVGMAGSTLRRRKRKR